MIAENLQILRNRINQICSKVNLDSKSVKLIAVSKSFGIDEIRQAIQAGQTEFGENKAQELTAKYDVLGNQIIWHFIGHLQKNKVKYAVRTADYIHSVYSLLLAEEIQKHAEKLGKIQKAEKEEIKEIAKYCSQASNLNLIGLMTIAPLTEDKNLIRKSFNYLCKLKEELNSEGYGLKELSMGMTSDYEIAIEEGATMLRIGSAIFGERIYNKE